MENDDPIEFRIGVFFYLMSAIVLAIFIASDFANKADFDYFFMSLVLFSVGWYFRRNKKDPPRAPRFVWFKNFFQGMKKKSAPKKK